VITAYYVSLVGLLIGAGMGLYGMINPRWAARLVRLRDDPDRPGGFAEFRGTYGGLFLGAHGFALAFLVPFLQEREVLGAFPTHWVALGAIGVCAMMWLATSIGRAISIVADKTGGGFNYSSVGFEVALGLVIAAPVIAMMLQ
jgi:hypothetical protein